MTEHVVAVFHDAAAADAAERELKAAGVPATAIRRYTGTYAGAASSPVVSEADRTERSAAPSGFWAWLLGEETSTGPSAAYRQDFEHYDRSVMAGETVLSVTLTDTSQINRAVSILEAHNPVGIDESTQGEHSTVSGSPSSQTDAFTAESAQPASTQGAGYISQSGISGSPSSETNALASQQAGQPSSQSEEVIPLAEEEIEIGKRTVDRGTTRVRRYVVETPVERDVTLRGERVTVERRSPTTTSEADDRQFEERVVEVRETEEEPVVQKSAHVSEEVAVRREATERTEKVRDTVRKEEVEITPDDRDGSSPRSS